MNPFVQKFLSLYRSWGRGFLFGIFEQGLLSGTSFVVTVILARVLGATEFGWFSVIWAFVIFLESAANGLFGDAIPSLAHKLRESLWPQFRASIFLSMLTVCVVVCVPLLLVAGGLELAGFVYPAAVIPAIFFFGVQRMQNVVRRTYYLDGLRGRAALSACANVAVTFAALEGVHKLFGLSASSAFICLSAGSVAALITGASYIAGYERPSRRLYFWVIRNLWLKGRWTMASATMSWIGNMGVIPFAAFLISPVAGGGVRAIQTMVLPLVQVNQILISILVPKMAGKMRTEGRGKIRQLAVKLIALLSLIGFSYAAVIAIGGEALFEALFHFEKGQITNLAITIAVLGYAFEGIRYGCNIMLYSVGDTVIVGQGQIVSMLSAIVIIPILGHYFGLTGLVLGMTIANNINTLYVAGKFFRAKAPLGTRG